MKAQHSLFGQKGAGFEEEAVERRVLACDVRGRGGAFQIQAPDDDVEHGGDSRQLHPVEHGRHLRRHRVHLWLVSAHGWSDNRGRKEKRKKTP